jgi:hypothetical protein
MLLEKLLVAQLVTKFSACFETKRGFVAISEECHNTRSKLKASHRRGQPSRPDPRAISGGRSGQCDRYLYECFGFTFHYHHTAVPYSLLPSGGWTMGPLATGVPKQRSLNASKQ